MKKGFTLIELLAVIVILAIIALIATPIVLDIIEDSKNSSIKRSIELYADAVENSVAKAQLNGSVVPSGKYTTTDGETLTQGNTTIKVDYDGAKTVCEVYISNEGTVSLKRCNVSDKDVEYTYGNKIYENGEVVYFDVTKGETCNNYIEENSNTGYNGINGTGNQNGCLKFYAFNDFGSDKLNLILDHNTTANVAWVSNEDWLAAGGVLTDEIKNTTACLSGNVCLTNEFGPVTLLSNLYNDTQYWNGVEIPTNHSIDQSTQTSGAKYTIDYSNYKARIITAWEIAQITGNLAWNEKNEDIMYFFDTHTTAASNTCKSGNISGCKYGWLYDRTSTSCTTYGCLNNSDQTTSGYWTATSSAKGKIYSWLVYYSAVISNSFGTTGTSDSYGVRPVIEVLKSKLS